MIQLFIDGYNRNISKSSVKQFLHAMFLSLPMKIAVSFSSFFVFRNLLNTTTERNIEAFPSADHEHLLTFKLYELKMSLWDFNVRLDFPFFKNR